MEINHCYPDSGDSSLSSSNHQKHLGSPCAAFCKMSWGVDGGGGDGWAGGETGRGMGWGETGRDGHINHPSVCAGALHKRPRAVSKFCWRIKVIKERGAGGSPVYSPRTARSHTHWLTRVRLWCLLLSVRDQYFKRPIKEEIELGIDWSAVKVQSTIIKKHLNCLIGYTY